jgi:hypothetical protein
VMTEANQQTSWLEDPMRCHIVSSPQVYLHKENNANNVHMNSTDHMPMKAIIY